MDYGFVVPGNPHDRVAVRFDPGLLELAREVAGVSAPLGAGKPGSSPSGLDAAPWQLVVLRDLALAGSAARLEVELGGPAGDGVDPRLLAALRVLYATGPAALRGIPQGKQGARTRARGTRPACARSLAPRRLPGPRRSRAARPPSPPLPPPPAAEALQHPQAGCLSPENEALVLRTALALVAIVLGQFRSTLNVRGPSANARAPSRMRTAAWSGDGLTCPSATLPFACCRMTWRSCRRMRWRAALPATSDSPWCSAPTRRGCSPTLRNGSRRGSRSSSESLRQGRGWGKERGGAGRRGTRAGRAALRGEEAWLRRPLRQARTAAGERRGARWGLQRKKRRVLEAAAAPREDDGGGGVAASSLKPEGGPHHHTPAVVIGTTPGISCWGRCNRDDLTS